MARERQIIAIGGGGFLTRNNNLAMERYILGQCPVASPRVCFVNTASSEEPGNIVGFYQAFNGLDVIPSHLSLFNPATEDLAGFVLEKDIVYVGGGNTRSLLALWREWGLDAIMRQAWRQGIVLAGMSAGSICWFDSGVTDSIPGTLTALPCLGFLAGSNCPHYDGEVERRPAYQRLVLAGELAAGWAADDDAALHFKGDSAPLVVSARSGARAYRVEAVAGKIRETPLEPDLSIP